MLTPSQSDIPDSIDLADNSKADRNDRSAQPYQVPIIYKLACTDNVTYQRNVKIDRYSSAPFQGLEDPENRQSLSVMDVVDSVSGMFTPDKPARKNQRREDFGTHKLEDDSTPFIVGQDFISRSYSVSSLRIMSPFVIDFLKEGLLYYPSEIRDQELWINEPYRMLAYNYDRFVDAVDIGECATSLTDFSIDTTGRDHLRVLLDWYRPYYRKEIEPEFSLHACGKATYEKLWLLYKPGDIVFTGEGEHIDCYIVHSLYHPVGKVDGAYVEQPWYWNLSLWCFDFDGTLLVRRSKAVDVQIPKFTGEKDISRLHFVPLTFMKPEQGSKQSLIDRGKLHFQLFREAPVLRQYRGALSGNKALQYSGAVIVDPLTYTERRKQTNTLGTIAPTADVEDRRSNREPDDFGGGPLYSRFNGLDILQDMPFEDDDMYLLLPRRVRGFALGKKQWARFDTSSFLPPDTATGAFDNLVMNADDIGLLKALGSLTPADTKGVRQADFIEGKGVGKVVLLHGPPGVGKSFTVECLARDLEKPLLPLTVADIGTDQSTIEEKLSGWLDLAQRWNAIVLIDEADAYLERRSHNELSRNALVTVFLRVLEYFPGMIVLTTNQPGFIDDAFISRLNLTIEYKEMNEDTRKKVWRQFLRKYLREQEGGMGNQPKVNILQDVQTYVTSDPEIVKLGLNGRDIRNAFDSAVKVATYRMQQANKGGSLSTVELEVDDFKQAVENKKALYDYLNKVEGRTEWKRAYGRGARAPFESL